MSITGLTAVTRVAPTTANTPTETARPQQPSAAPAVKIDAVTQLPAPPRLSMTNTRPCTSVSFCATSRATRSALPPGGNAKRTGLLGYVAASLAALASRHNAKQL